MADASKFCVPGSGRQLDINVVPASFLNDESERTDVCELVKISYARSGQTIIVRLTCKCSVSTHIYSQNGSCVSPNFEVSRPTFEYQMRRSGNSLQRFAPNVPTFRQNVRANLANFIQDLCWRVRFSNEDIKTVGEDLASLGDR